MTAETPNFALRAVQSAREDADPCDGVDPDDVVKALRLALHAARIKLPDLQVDGCTCGAMPGAPMVELGTVRADVALRLAEVIGHGAMHSAVSAANARSRGERL